MAAEGAPFQAIQGERKGFLMATPGNPFCKEDEFGQTETRLLFEIMIKYSLQFCRMNGKVGRE